MHHLWLDRLTHADVASFLACVYGRPLPSKTADALHARTGGNPFFLEEILSAAGRGARRTGHPTAAVHTGGDRAPSARRTGRRRASSHRRSRGARAGCVVRHAHRGHAHDRTELIGHLRALVERGLIVEDRPDEFVFRHALVRDAVEDQLLGRERRRSARGGAGGVARLGQRRSRGVGPSRPPGGPDRRVPRAGARRRNALPRTSGRPTRRCSSRRTHSREDPDCLTLLETADPRGVARRAATRRRSGTPVGGVRSRRPNRPRRRGRGRAHGRPRRLGPRAARRARRGCRGCRSVGRPARSRTGARGRVCSGRAGSHAREAPRSRVSWSERAIDEADRWGVGGTRTRPRREGLRAGGLAGRRPESDRDTPSGDRGGAKLWAITSRSRARSTTSTAVCRCTLARARRSSPHSTPPRRARGSTRWCARSIAALQVEIAISEGDMARAQAGLDAMGACGSARSRRPTRSGPPSIRSRSGSRADGSTTRRRSRTRHSSS